MAPLSNRGSGQGPTSRFLGMKVDAIYTRGFETVRFATSNAKNILDHLAVWAFFRPAGPDRSAEVDADAVVSMAR